MGTRRKSVFFFLALAMILLFIAGSGGFITKNIKKLSTGPLPAVSSFGPRTSIKNDPFLQILPIRRSPRKYMSKTYLDLVPKDKPQILAAKINTLTASERSELLLPSLVVKKLKIKPGMEILDLGAGAGTFTFPLADELKNTGRVYATEVEPKLIKIMRDYMKKNKYKNVALVLVNREGIDPFYKQHQFDTILVCETLPCLRDIVTYFRELRPSLKKDGSLYIINARNVSDFDEIDFEDYEEAVKILRDMGEKFPVFKRLDKKVQNYIKNLPEGKISSSPPREIKTQILRDFNKMLSDRFLLNDLVDYFDSRGCYKNQKHSFSKEPAWAGSFARIIHPAEFGLFKWLFFQLDEEGVFDRDNKITFTAEQKEELKKLNKMTLSGIFHLFGTSLIINEFRTAVFLGKKSIIFKMKKAGYRFANDYNCFSQYYFLEFKRQY